jgi:hypothetical protein
VRFGYCDAFLATSMTSARSQVLHVHAARDATRYSTAYSRLPASDRQWPIMVSELVADDELFSAIAS